MKVINIFKFYNQGLKRKRDHVGNKERFSWDKEQCLLEVNSYINDTKINYTELSRKYNLKNDSGET